MKNLSFSDLEAYQRAFRSGNTARLNLASFTEHHDRRFESGFGLGVNRSRECHQPSTACATSSTLMYLTCFCPHLAQDLHSWKTRACSGRLTCRPPGDLTPPTCTSHHKKKKKKTTPNRYIAHKATPNQRNYRAFDQHASENTYNIRKD